MSGVNISPSFCWDYSKERVVECSTGKVRGDFQDADVAIDVFEDQVEGWHFSECRSLAAAVRDGDTDKGMPLLVLTITYLEAVEGFRKGETSHQKEDSGSRGYVVEALRRVCSLNKNGREQPIPDRFYDAVRCGLFHDLNLSAGVRIEHGAGSPVSRDGDGAEWTLVVNPCALFDAVGHDFAKYVAALRRPDITLLGAFKKRWSAMKPPEKPPQKIVALPTSVTESVSRPKD